MKRDLSMDALRGVAALFVVLLHVTALRLDETSGPQWAAINLLNGLTRWTVPVFIMLSGAFLSGRRNEDTGGLWAKRVGRTAGILLFWNIVYFFARTKGTALPSPHDLIYPNAYHLWFMYLLTGLYALLPLLRRIATGRTEGCFVALWTVLCTTWKDWDSNTWASTRRHDRRHSSAQTACAWADGSKRAS